MPGNFAGSLENQKAYALVFDCFNHLDAINGRFQTSWAYAKLLKVVINWMLDLSKEAIVAMLAHFASGKSHFITILKLEICGIMSYEVR